MLDPMVNGPQRRDQMSGPQRPRPLRPRPLLRTTLGEVLRRTRQEQHRTLADVARAAKVSMPYLSEVERGRKEASSEVLAAICDALHVELADVLLEVGRDLVDRDLVGRAPVFRLDTMRGATMAPPVRRSGDAQCLLAA
jgi:DNA-binding XRE family transcriptional regulator